MADITFTLAVKDKGGVVKEFRKIKGQAKDVVKELDRMGTKRLKEEAGLTTRQVSTLKKEIRATGKAFGDAGGKAKIMVDQTAKLEKVSSHGSGRSRKYRHGNVAITKAEYQALLKKNHALQVQTRLNRGVAVTQESVNRQMRKTILSAKSRALRAYSFQMVKMRTQMKAAGLSSEQMARALDAINDEYERMKRINPARIANRLQRGGGGVGAATEFGRNLYSGSSAKLQGLLPGAQASMHEMLNPGPSMAQQMFHSLRSGLQQFSIRAGGAIGFTLIDVGTKIQNMFSGKMFKGQLSNASSALAGTVGGIFGDAIGSIASDLGKFVGTIAELSINLFTFKIRKIASVIGGVVKAAGYTIASGLVGGILGSFGGPGVGTAIGAAVGVVGGLIIFAATSTMQSLSAIVTETLLQITDIFEKAFSGITAIVSAGFKIIGTIFKSAGKLLSVTWNTIWDGLTKTVKKAVDATLKETERLTKESINAFIELESVAAKAGKEIADIYGTDFSRMMGVIAKSAAKTGEAIKSVGDAGFTGVSSNFRKYGELGRIMTAAEGLAIRDMTSMENAIKPLIVIWENYKDAMKNPEEVARTLSAATTLGVTDLEELSSAMKYGVVTAKRYGVSLEDFLGSAAILSRKFGRGSMDSVMRYLSRFMESIYMPTSGGAKALKEIGINSKELLKAGKGNLSGSWLEMLKALEGLPYEKIRKVFPTIQARRAMVLTEPGAVKEFETLMKDMKSITKNIKLQEKIGKNVAERVFKRIGIIINNIKTRYGEVLVRVMKFVFFNKKIEQVWMHINNIMFSPQMQARINSIVNTLKTVLMPIIKAIYTNFVKISQVMEKFAYGILFNPEDLDRIKKAFADIIAEVSKFSGNLLGDNAGLTALNLLVEGFSKIAEEISNIVKDLLEGKILDRLKGYWEKIKPHAVRIMGELSNFLASGFQEIVANVGLSLSDLILGAEPGKIDLGVFENIFKTIALSAEVIFLSAFKRIGIALIDTFLNSENSFIKGIRDAIADIYDMMRNVVIAALTARNVFANIAKLVQLPFKLIVYNLALLLEVVDDLMNSGFAKRFAPGMQEGWNSAAQKIKKRGKSENFGEAVKNITASGGFAAQKKLLDTALLGAYSEAEQQASGLLPDIKEILKGGNEQSRKAIENLKETVDVRIKEATNELKKLREDAKSGRTHFGGKLAGEAGAVAGFVKNKWNETSNRVAFQEMEREMRNIWTLTKRGIGGPAKKISGASHATHLKDIQRFGQMDENGNFVTPYGTLRASNGGYSGLTPEAVSKMIAEAATYAMKGIYTSAKEEGTSLAGESALERTRELAYAINTLAESVKPGDLYNLSKEQAMEVLAEGIVKGMTRAKVAIGTQRAYQQNDPIAMMNVFMDAWTKGN